MSRGPRSTRPERRPSPSLALAGGAAIAAQMRDRQLGEAMRAYRAGRYGEVETGVRRMLAAAPDFFPAVLLMGMVAGKTGRASLGIELLRRALALDRKSVVALNELANLLLATGAAAEARSLSRRALRLEPGDAAAHNNLGLADLALGRPAEAAAGFARALARQPGRAVLHANLGMALQHLGRRAEAAAAYRRATALDPHQPDANIGVAELLIADDRRDEALAALRRAAAAQPKDAGLHLRIGEALLAAGEISAAEQYLRQAAVVDPQLGEAHRLLGNALHQLGRFDEAIASYRRAIGVAPRLAQAYFGIASAQKITPADQPLIEAMRALLDDPGLSPMDCAALHYALGKSFDDLASYAEAMHHFDAANRISGERLRLAGRAIDRRRHAENIDRLIASFTPERFGRPPVPGEPGELAVLIVGMVRSGTTLVEQILSSHREVAAGGELRFWGQKGALLAAVEAGAFDPAAALLLAEEYAAVLRRLAPAARRVTDKMPTNFLLLGLVHLALPRARIIHCRRHPVDTCLSIYTTAYANLPDFAYDRDTIAFYWEQYARLMAHWRRVLPADRFFEVDYEELVASREAVTRRIVAFCGLDWDESCLQPETNRRVVRTPSAWQVRQPVHANSVERWRRYEAWLGPFRRLLPEAPEPGG